MSLCPHFKAFFAFIGGILDCSYTLQLFCPPVQGSHLHHLPVE